MRIPRSGPCLGPILTVTARPAERRELARAIVAATEVIIEIPPNVVAERGIRRAIAALGKLRADGASVDRVARRLRTLEAQLQTTDRRLLAAVLEREERPDVSVVGLTVAPSATASTELQLDL